MAGAYTHQYLGFCPRCPVDANRSSHGHAPPCKRPWRPPSWHPVPRAPRSLVSTGNTELDPCHSFEYIESLSDPGFQPTGILHAPEKATHPCSYEYGHDDMHSGFREPFVARSFLYFLFLSRFFAFSGTRETRKDKHQSLSTEYSVHINIIHRTRTRRGPSTWTFQDDSIVFLASKVT